MNDLRQAVTKLIQEQLEETLTRYSGVRPRPGDMYIVDDYMCHIIKHKDGARIIATHYENRATSILDVTVHTSEVLQES